MAHMPSPDELAVMLEKYRIERDKRLRSDGPNQYLQASGSLSAYGSDPHADESLTREAIVAEFDVVLIGGGLGGLLTGARLHEAGIADVCIIEQGSDFGGTWYWNRYPGAQCDVESYIYLPLLEELGYMPSEKYARGREILEHCQAVARHYRLYDNALLQTSVTEARWDSAIKRWVVKTDRNDTIKARFISMANGPLSRPKLPGIDGIHEFAGHSFHTSRWDYRYTGGNDEGGLTGLKDKRVAIIGTGASAIQCIPHLAESAQHLYVFQRTPSTVDIRHDAKTDQTWAASLEPGWQKRRRDNFNQLTSGLLSGDDLVKDGWTESISRFYRTYKKLRAAGIRRPSPEEVGEFSNFEKMNGLRTRIDETVKDPVVAESLKPYYKLLCKRPCFHDQYLQTFNRDNVTLVDTDGQGASRITASGLEARGENFDVDCIIFATGFELGRGNVRNTGYDVIGREGKTLAENWANGIRTLHGLQTHGFPNCFILGQGQGAFAVNYTHTLDEQAAHITYIIDHALNSSSQQIEVTKDAEEAWVKQVLDKASASPIFGGSECTPSYYNNEGQPEAGFAQALDYGGGSIEFFNILKEWRQNGRMEGLERT